MYTNIGDKIIALAKVGYATNNVDKNLMKGIADWARSNTTGWTLSATDPKTGTVDSNWSPNQEDWTDVYNFAKEKGYNTLTNYLTQNGYYFSQASPTVSNVNSTMQASQALATQAANNGTTVPVNDYTNGINLGTATGYGYPAQGIPQTPVTVSGSGQPNPTPYDPVAAANKTADDYSAMALRAGQTDLSAQMAQAQWAINNGGIWKSLQPEYQKQLDSAISTLTQISAIAKANVSAQKASMDAEQAMNYQNALDDLDRNLVASRQRTTEEMNQRGLFFSTVLDSVMGKVEAASATQRGVLGRQNIVELGKIAAQMATLTANIDIQELQGKAAAVAQYGAAMLNWIAQDEQTKQSAQAILAGLEVKQKGLADTVGMAIFGTVQGIQQQGRQEAAAQTETDWNNWVANIGQYAMDYQKAINELDPNDPLYSRKLGALNAARTGKVIDTQANELKNYLASVTQFSTNYQAEIDRLQNSNDPNKGIKIAALMEARSGKLDNLMKEFVATIGQYSGNYQGAIDALLKSNDPLKDRKISYLRAALADQQAAAATNIAGGSSGTGGSSSSGTSSSVPKITFANAQTIISNYESAEEAIKGYTLNGDTGMYEKQTTDMYGAPTTKTMSPDEYKMYADRLKSQKDNYDAAKQFQSRMMGTVLTGDDAINADTVIQDVIGVQRTHYGISNKDALDLVLTSTDSMGETILQFILKQPNGENILRALEKFYGVSILGG